jgi:hypothetical protein
MNMSYKEVLEELQELRDNWRRNYFTYTESEQERYDLLLAVRRERVASFYRDDKVFKGSHNPTSR